ncbi:hypothetical protein F2P56_033333 [Juglans regia]|uniref:Uncharacterized protein LOC108998676 n=2 Tax=Juglans regia TaxID=51240 RepID=A0A2I4FGW2_JUGRE|nr:uncharacterized protein LOC108998676 [Juglans regia]XP_035540909.1 uncharacterized protein LOC108998676 [Juglans regia]XP_035540910.1 uncharacterized protein LOC108998676 [Juglans regia]KAF5447811.1 hypothetical protein F2P56_033333 [Juglans regia]
MVPAVNQEQRKHGRGPAKCTEFLKLRKHGKVHLKINDGKTAPCCENASMFTTRVTWIVKHHCEMSYAKWTDVPQAQKDELIDCVRGDFVLDWELENHRLTVLKQLRKRFNAFHHELHKKYLSYGSHEEALAFGTSMVDSLVWIKLCERWGSDAFKKISSQNRENRKRLNINHTVGRKSFVRILEEKRATKMNLVEFYKETRWSKKNGKFVTSATEDTYKKMVGKLDDLEPEKCTDDAAASVFREVLGHRPGYARGLGEMVIPESTRQRDREREKEYLASVEEHKKDADHYKTQLDEMRGEMRVLLERQNEIDKKLRSFFANFPSHGESLGETQ